MSLTCTLCEIFYCFPKQECETIALLETTMSNNIPHRVTSNILSMDASTQTNTSITILMPKPKFPLRRMERMAKNTTTIAAE